MELLYSRYCKMEFKEKHVCVFMSVVVCFCVVLCVLCVFMFAAAQIAHLVLPFVFFQRKYMFPVFLSALLIAILTKTNDWKQE